MGDLVSDWWDLVDLYTYQGDSSMQPRYMKQQDFQAMATHLNATQVIDEKKKNVYNIRVESAFLLTQRQIKEYLGIGYKVISVETEKDFQAAPITDVDSAVQAMIQAGYRSLARAHHPDLGGSQEVMMILNRAKKEISDLLKSL